MVLGNQVLPEVGDIVILRKDFLDWHRNLYTPACFEPYRDEKIEIVKIKENDYDPSVLKYYMVLADKGYRPIDAAEYISLSEDSFNVYTDPVFYILERAFERRAKEAKENPNPDKCPDCGITGQVRGMACICNVCGKVIWGC